MIDITKNEIIKYFDIGDIVESGGRRTFFEITKFYDDCIQVRPTGKKSIIHLFYRSISIILESIDEVEEGSIVNSIEFILTQEGVNNTTGAGYMYGFVNEYLRRQNGAGTVAKLDARLQKEVEESSRLSSEERRARLTIAPKSPRKIQVLTTVFERNADVIAERLAMADGKCEHCGKPAPFLRRMPNGSPFLEVHHKIRLADGGEDSVDNTQALCPNCHRKAHYG